MSNKPTGGPAFPTKGSDTARRQAEAVGVAYNDPEGMTLRDYFAVHASEEDVRAQAEVIRLAHGVHILPDGWHITARYMHADQMLEARKS